MLVVGRMVPTMRPFVVAVAAADIEAAVVAVTAALVVVAAAIAGVAVSRVVSAPGIGGVAVAAVVDMGGSTVAASAVTTEVTKLVMVRLFGAEIVVAEFEIVAELAMVREIETAVGSIVAVEFVGPYLFVGSHPGLDSLNFQYQYSHYRYYCTVHYHYNYNHFFDCDGGCCCCCYYYDNRTHFD